MERALHDAGEHRRADAVPGDIRDEQRGLSGSRRGIVVQVAAEARPWCIPAADREAVHEGLAVRQQTLLKCAGFGDLGLESLQVVAMLLPPASQLTASLDERLEHFAVERC